MQNNRNGGLETVPPNTVSGDFTIDPEDLDAASQHQVEGVSPPMLLIIRFTG